MARLARLGLVGLLHFGAGSAFADLTIVDDRAGAFIDISGDPDATALNLSADDVVTWATSIFNDVFAPPGDVLIGNNGGVGFDDGAANQVLNDTNAALPSAGAFNLTQALLAAWDDHGNSIGDVYAKNASDRLIIQWHNSEFGDSTDTSRFQIQIFDGVTFPVGPSGAGFPAPPIFAQMIYDDIEQPRAGGGASMTIGYQDGAAGFNDVQWSFNTAGAVSNGTVLSLIPEPSGLVLVLALAPLVRRRG